MKLVGLGLSRVDGRSKVTGQATYAAEVPVANIVHAVIVGATQANGAIAALETGDAERAAGVLAVLTHANAPRIPNATPKKDQQERVLQMLQDDRVRYHDQPIALVIADTLERAQHGAALVRATYTGAPPPLSELDHALDTAVMAKSAGPRGAAATSRGDVDGALAGAAHKVSATYTTPVENHHPMEMHATIAVWQGPDHLTLYDSTQGVFNVRQRLAGLFALPKANVRVINHFVGGGFGSKGAPWSHVALAALAARAVGRPVKLVVTRQQMCSLTGHRPRTVQKVALGADAGGKLVAIRHEVTSETSRFDEFVEASAVAARMLYSCPNVATAHRLVRIDVPTPTFCRAPGESTGTYALESAMDELAYATGLDPVELRIRNHATRDEGENKPFSSKSLLECYKRAGEQFGWARRDPRPRSMRDGPLLVGWGMATAVYPSRQLPASARARLRADGRALVQAGTQDLGTGTYTIMTQLAADALGLPFEHVTFELGDTALPETPLSAGSFTASSTGSAVKLACDKLRDELVMRAVVDPRSPLFGAPRDRIDAVDGALVLRGTARRDPFSDLVARAGEEPVAEHKTQPSPHHDQMSMHAYGAVFVEAKVDPELARVQLTRIVGAYGAGQILNAKTARSQLIGGIVWGIGMALVEETVRDPRTARVATRDLADYHLPVNADVPDIDVITVDERDPYVNEIGAKGVGEIGNTGTAAAIANAVYHATGVRVRDLPIRVDRLLVG